ncbi:MAG TPA: hypothetical protein VGX23_10220 [Actinocrinis sp.]|nr:hypothetical protein [Actinocrinis sp.]
MFTWSIEDFLTALGARHTLANLRSLLQHRLRTRTHRPRDFDDALSGGAQRAARG